ncbi:MAG: hypothetical protein AB1491_10020 [Thermodesulfobacteriota bacterium]
MKSYLPDIFLLIVGVLVMVLLLYLGAVSEGWVALLCFLATAVVYHTWQVQLIRMGQKALGKDIDLDGGHFPG